MSNLATEKGRAFARKALEQRRQKNKNIKRVDNGSLYAGDPMYFYCITCGGEIVVPENYITRPELCGECQALKKLGWLE